MYKVFPLCIHVMISDDNNRSNKQELNIQRQVEERDIITSFLENKISHFKKQIPPQHLF